MVGVAACCGVALGAALGLLLRRERPFQLLAVGLLSVALAVAFLLSGAALPAIGVLLLGAIASVVLLGPSARAETPRSPDEAPIEERGWGPLLLSAAVALAVTGVLIGAGWASRSDLLAGAQAKPSLALVGHQLVMGTGVAVLALVVLAGATVVGGAALIQRDPREAAEEQAEQSRRRRLEAQRRRQAQREAARAAARAARRGGSR
ncbi:MAG: hypothetical protein ACREN1_05420 [Candidatus Dormibacteria bacterium]